MILRAGIGALSSKLLRGRILDSRQWRHESRPRRAFGNHQPLWGTASTVELGQVGLHLLVAA
jgi:hypothetical protein